MRVVLLAEESAGLRALRAIGGRDVELIAVVHMGTKSKHSIKLCWCDDFSATNEKIVYPTL